MDNMSSDVFNKEIIEHLPQALIVLKSMEDGLKIIRKNSRFDEINKNFLALPADTIHEGDFIKISNIIDNHPNNISKALMSIALEVLVKEPGYFRRTTVMFKGNHDSSKRSPLIDKPGLTPFHVIIFKIQSEIIGIMLEDISSDDSKSDVKESDSFHVQMHSVFNFLPSGIFMVEENIVKFVNNIFIENLGYEDDEQLLGRRIEEFVHPDDLPEFLDYLSEILEYSGEDINDREFRFIKKKGQAIWFSLSNSFYYDQHNDKNSVIFSCIDITDKKKTELTLLQTHRLASIGDLTAGIAHEINNPLFGIMNYAALLLDSLNSNEPIIANTEEHEFIEGIAEEAQRISNIINNLAEFTRKSEEREFKPTNLKEIIKKVEKLLAYQIRHTFVTIKKDFPEDLPLLRLQTFRIEQAIFNIMLNSIHALEDSGRKDRKIEISIRIEESRPKDFLYISIYDNGIGIKDENMVKMFNPFFTTKRGIKGSGLGLHQVYNIVSDHHGKVNIDSEYGKWTTVEIIVPIDYTS